MDNTLYSSTYNSSWALLIGINEYKNAPDLSYACNDADSVQATLVNKLGFPEEKIILLRDGQATKIEIMDQFINLHTKARHLDDRVLFFFAGHGLTFPANNGPIGYLIPVDGDPKNLNSLIRWDDITRNAELIPAKHILFVMDACYSGLAIRRTLTPGVQRFVSDLLQRPARQVITAGKADQTVADGGPSGKNSLFTSYLLQGINGSAVNPEGVLTANSLMCYLHNQVGQDPSSQQTPHYGHIEGDGDFILLTPGQEHLLPESSGAYLVEVQQEYPEDADQVESSIVKARPSFALIRGYGNPKHPNYGRNELSSKLGEYRIADNNRGIERALSWCSVVIEPLVNQSISLNIGKMATGANDFYVQGNEPYERFKFPQSHRTTIDSLLMYSEDDSRGYWSRYLSIEQTGTIEYADALNSFIEVNDQRMFYFVDTIGLTWQLLFLAKSLLLQAGYKATVRITYSLVGTRDSILVGFSQEEGAGRNRWKEPTVEPFGLRHIGDRGKCTDVNLKVEHDLALNRLNYDESLKVIKSIAQRIELAYNHHDFPRCFNYGTDSFPWRQYANAIRW